MSAKGVRLSIDIGGTFTDLVLIDGEDPRPRIAKTLTTPENPADGALRGLEQILGAERRSAADLAQVIHATTLITNALIERKGVRTGLLTTRGFRDSIQIARESRYDIYDLFLELPKALVPRRWRREVDERLLADGSTLMPLDETQAEGEIRLLLDAGVEAIGICLLHSYRNPEHERRLGALVRRLAPHLAVSLSSDVVPTLREYERSLTTVANVYVRPVMDGYLEDLQRRLAERGFATGPSDRGDEEQRLPGQNDGGSLLIMLSAGSVCTPETARRFPIRAVESGPAAGALAAAAYARVAGRERVLSFDMGGTTAKACLIEEGQALTTSQLEVARVHRFKKGSGFPLEVASIDMMEIGAGGGSIARVDQFGLLKVGPDSAGANPGPACYGQGGRSPTVTDADLLLGYISPDFFLGGEMRLDAGAAHGAIARELATPLQMDLIEAAWGVHQVVNENMATATRIYVVERGRDLKDYALLAFGGAGPLHACRVARILGIDGVIVPFGAGATSAFGCLWAPLAFDFVRSQYFQLHEVDWARLNELLVEMEREGRALLRQAGLQDGQMTVRRSGDMRYMGQGFEISVALPDGSLGPEHHAGILAAFESEYRRLYQRACPDIPAEALHWRLVVSGPRPSIGFATGVTATGIEARKGSRPAYVPEAGGFVDTAVYNRYGLAPGDRVAGPAIIEERESTAILPPNSHAFVDEQNNLVIQLG